MTRTLLALISAIALAPFTAQAADMPMKAPAPPPAPVMSWTGCYIDGGVGYGFWNQDHALTGPFGGAIVGSTTTRDGGRGWLGRVGGGCDYQVAPRWVIGILGDYDFMNLKGSFTPMEVIGLGAGGGAPFFPLTANMKQENAGYVGARLGYLITPTVLGYIDGGWSRTRFTQTSEFTNLGVAVPFSYPGAFNQNGWFVGGGTEVALTDWIPIHGLFLRSEYRYAQYGSTNLAEFSTVTGAPTGNVQNTKASVQTITTSLVWKFNWLGH